MSQRVSHLLDRLLGRRTDPRARLGRRGEAHAARLLRRDGYRVLARNARTAAGEADLVAIDPDGRTLVVVEVKSRASAAGPRPAVSLRPPQIDRLRRIATLLARANPHDGTPRPARVDLYELIFDGRRCISAVRTRVC